MPVPADCITTEEPPLTADNPTARHLPAALHLWALNAPTFRFHDLTVPLTLGRTPGTLPESDDRASRNHCTLAFDSTTSDFLITDLGSANKTYLDGSPLPANSPQRVSGFHVLRAGRSAFLLDPDARRFLPDRSVVTNGDRVEGPGLVRTLEQIARAARGGTTLLLRGESGTGKEYFARAFAALARPKKKVVSVNVSSLPPELLDASFVGTVRGSHSGAHKDTRGFLDEADGGTLVLDEIGDLPLALQVKLLRWVEFRTFYPLGSTVEKRVDVAIVASTHRDLEEECRQNRFRNDLRYRLSQQEIVIPPLRDRREEIPALLHLYARPHELTVPIDVVERALLHPWQGGNAREVSDFVGKANVLGSFDLGRLAPLPSHEFVVASVRPPPPVPASSGELKHPKGKEFLALPSAMQREIFERLRATHPTKQQLSDALGIGKTKLYALLKEWGVESD